MIDIDKMMSWSQNGAKIDYESYKDNEKLSAVVRELPQDTTNVFKDIYSLEFLGLPKIHKKLDELYLQFESND